MVENFPSSLEVKSEELSDDEKEFINLVKDGGAFVNPIADKIDEAKNKLASERSAVNSINIVFSTNVGIGGGANTGTTTTTLDVSPIVSALDSLDGVLDSFRTHTNRLSGAVIRDPDLDNPHINTLLSIGTAYISQLKTMGELTAGKFEEIFGSIIEGKELVDDAIVEFEDTEEDINNAHAQGDSEQELESLVSTIATNIGDAESAISQRMTDDENAFDDAWDFVIKYALGRYVQSAASNDHVKHLMNEFIGTTELNNKING